MFSAREGHVTSTEIVIKEHLKIADYIIQKISNEELGFGQKVPSVNQLTDELRVNRNSVVRALVRLENQGWLTALHGKGYFVNKREDVIMSALSRHSRHTNLLKRLGEKRDVRLLNWTLDQATVLEAETLGLSVMENVFRLEILRFIRGHPMSLATSSIPEKLVPDMERHLASFASLYDILEEYYGFVPIRKISYIEARMPLSYEAKLLQMTENIPILWRRNLNVQLDGTPAVMDIARIRGDRYQLVVDLENIEKKMTVSLNPQDRQKETQKE